MYTILMNEDKSLVITVKKTIYQGENLVDKIQFLCPESYDGLSLKKCKVLLKYIDQGNVPHCETLLIDDEIYKGKIRCVLPLNTKLTRFAGTIQISLTFVDMDNETQTKRILHSGDTLITIIPKDVKFQLCEDENNNNNNNNDDGNDNNGGNSTTDEEFKAVEF